LGIALVGDSKILVLDEPTSGMDTITRRKVQNLLRKYKENKIILFTTHYIEEADILGDRICIMS
jgi:ABC-type multidrug transport system ATPase subunit